MPTLSTVIDELKRLPQHRLREVYHLIKTINDSNKIADENHKSRIFGFKGLFKDMSENEYADFKEYLQKSRESLFTRNPEI